MARQDRREPRLQDVLLAEAIRLREEAGETLPGSATAAAAARAAGGDFEARIVHRAGILPAAAPLRTQFAHLRSALLIATMAGGILALAAGSGAAFTVLTTRAGEPVNVFQALGVLLGVPLLTLFGWLLFMITGTGRMAAGVLGHLLFSAAGRLARWTADGPAPMIAVRAATEILAHGGLGRWLASSLSHALWLLYLLGGLAALLVHFSTREYAFTWATTILAERHYIVATRTLGTLPGWMGFPVPTPEVIIDSSRTHDTGQSKADRRTWAGLMLGAIVAYGIVPRALALLVAAAATWRALQHLQLHTGHAGYARLRALLMPASERGSVVDPDLTEAGPRPAAAPPPALGANGPVAVVGLEIDCPADTWPPPVEEIDWLDLGFVNDRGDRHRVLETLKEFQPLRAVLVVCALPVTPDRGHLAFIRALLQQTDVAILMLLTGGQRLRARSTPQNLESRLGDWRQLAITAGIPAERVLALDLDHLTDDSTRRLARWLGAEQAPTASDTSPASIGVAFAHIVEHARRWSAPPDQHQRLALQTAIAALYRQNSGRFFTGLGLRLNAGLPDTRSLTTAAQRTIALLPGRMRLDGRWLAAGAVAGGLGCLAAAALATPAAIAALPAWAGLGAALAAVLNRSHTAAAALADATDFGDAVATACLFALIMHLQGRDESAITVLLEKSLGDGAPPHLTDAEAAAMWLTRVQQRFEAALGSTERAP